MWLRQTLCSFAKRFAINSSFRIFKILPKTLKTSTGSARATETERWPHTFHNWLVWIQTIGVSVCAPSMGNASPLVTLMYHSLCKVAANRWRMPSHWRCSARKLFISTLAKSQVVAISTNWFSIITVSAKVPRCRELRTQIIDGYSIRRETT